MNASRAARVPSRRAVHFLAATTVATLLSATATPADAASRSNSRWSGQNASAWWTQADEVSGPFGNYHEGSLYAYTTTKGRGDAYAFIADWDCDPGEVPGWGGHGEEPAEGLCDHLGFRWGEMYNAAFSVDRKLGTASLSGQLTLYGGDHGGGGSVGTPAVSMTWTGIGEVNTSTSTYRYRDGGSSYSDTYRSSWREAYMSGSIGAMGFDRSTSGGSISSFDMRSKSSSK